MTEAIDIFAGAGGYDSGAREIGIDPLGIEINDAACATREAAGLRTHQGDVAALDPSDFGPVELCIGSPPCPTFSAAGNGGGRHLTDLILRCLHELAAGNDTRAAHRAEACRILTPIYEEAERGKAKRKGREPDLKKAADRASRDADMSLLVVEPLRWALALEPRWIALEQVPEVLGIWSEMASILSTLGYHCWVGVLSAERYGVPQTRKRAILMADRERPVSEPPATHQRYLKAPKEDEDAGPSLFEIERAERRVLPEDRDLLPWVSMAEALGWAADDELEQQRGAGMVERHGDRPNRSGGEPAFTVRAGTGGIGTGLNRRFRNGNQANAAVSDEDEPAPTIHFGKALNQVEWVMEKTEDRPERKAQGAGNRPRSSAEPAATIDTRTDLSRWVAERPAPTIVTTRRSKDGLLVGRQLPPGEGENIGGHGWDAEAEQSHAEGEGHAVRISVIEAAVLQSFPADYPWQGSRSQQFLQVGNAIPPLLARAILSALVEPRAVGASDLRELAA